MEKRVYSIPQGRREDVEKMVAKYQRKAAKYGTELKVEYGEPYAKVVPVRRIDYITQTVMDVDRVMVEVFDLSIDGADIRKDGYSVVAKIEHMDGGNVINAFGGEVKQAWRTAGCRCEHCNSDRYRKVTFIVRHEDGSEKQVGSTCLKDYCGIDPHAIGYANEINEILLNEDVACENFNAGTVERAYDVIDMIAFAIRANKRQGYVKSGEPNSNKGMLCEWCKGRRPTDAERDAAQAMADAIMEISESDAIAANLDNVQSMIKSRYCKANHFGFIAYAPVAYERYLESVKRRQEREAAQDAERKASGYVGEIGKRIEVDVAEAKLVTCWDNQWGTTYLYKFRDTNGNVLVWFASTTIDDDVRRIKATVKDHSERDGVKQTIITRCKAA